MHAELKLFIYTFSFTLSTKMVQLQLHQNNNNNNNQIEMEMPEDKEKRPKFCINDHMDVLVEILKRLDGRSLGVAASVCRLWCCIARNDALWEHLCFRHVSPPPAGVRPVVVALGGYRRLYMVCVRPVLSRLRRQRRLIGGGGAAAEAVRKVWSRQEVELSLSLFCVDYYEKLLSGGGKVGSDAPASSLMFLCKAVNV